jgi:hypothetical protein
MQGMDAMATDESSHHEVSEQGRLFITQNIYRLYTRFKKHFAWFCRTQQGHIHPAIRAHLQRNDQWDNVDEDNIFRWRGRTPNHCLTSGLDDYPRHNPPSVWEVHVDLMSWMGFYADALAKVATYLHKSNILLADESVKRELKLDIERYESKSKKIWKNVDGKALKH